MIDNRLYGLKDEQAGCFRFFSFHYNDAVALRTFADEINREEANNILQRHAADFSLYFLGEVDADNGNISATGAKLVVNGASVLKKTEV